MTNGHDSKDNLAYNNQGVLRLPLIDETHRELEEQRLETFVNSDIDLADLDGEADIEESGQKINIREPLSKNIKVDKGIKMIGDYQIEKTLGQGTFGKVKQGFHIFTG